MNKDRMKGTVDEVVGSAKRKAGELTGNTKLQVEGMAQQVRGKIENAWGETRDGVRDVIESTEVHADAHVKLDVKKPTPANECNRP
ncbi:MAG: CsbD family protein [Terracidiphilus sp.]|nr:CsbD family protein [Terracidiphilus sp.]